MGRLSGTVDEPEVRGAPIKPSSALWACLLLALAGSAAARGYVHELTGTATVRSTPTAQQPLRVGDIVDAGQTIVTEPNSSAIIKFEDGQVMALGQRSSFAIREYAYNKQQVSASRAAFELLRGGLRFITGVIGSTNRNAVRITAGNATIGIRGTDGTIHFDPGTQVVSAAVNAGVIAMITPLGAQTLAPGTFTSAAPNRPPAAPAPVVQAPPVVRQTVTVLAQQPNIPVNTPVVVEVSARAVVAQAQVQALQQQAAQQPDNTALQQQVQQAQQQAAQALQEAATAAQNAFQAAIQAGAVPPAPPAPPPAVPVTTPASPAAEPAVETPAAETPAAEKPAPQPEKPAAEKPAPEPPPTIPQPPREPASRS